MNEPSLACPSVQYCTDITVRSRCCCLSVLAAHSTGLPTYWFWHPWACAGNITGCPWIGAETASIEQFICQTDDFTKTGSGQTQEKHSKRDVLSYRPLQRQQASFLIFAMPFYT